MSKSHDHHHHHHHHHDLDGRALVWSILINITITTAQIIGGVLSGSLALLSDAVHNLSDVLALIFAYIAKKLSQKEATLDYTYGLKRSEILATLINSVILVVVGIGLFYEAIIRLLEPQTIDSSVVIILAVVGIVGNGGSVLLLSAGAKHSMNMRSAYLHLLVDMLTSVAVLIGGLAMYYLNMPYVDSLLTIFIAVYLCYSSWGLINDSVRILMQFTPSQLDLSKLIAELSAMPSIKNIHKLHSWQLCDDDIYLDANVETYSDHTISECARIRSDIELICKKEAYNINNLRLEFSFSDDSSNDNLAGQ